MLSSYKEEDIQDMEAMLKHYSFHSQSILCADEVLYIIEQYKKYKNAYELCLKELENVRRAKT